MTIYLWTSYHFNHCTNLPILKVIILSWSVSLITLTASKSRDFALFVCTAVLGTVNIYISWKPGLYGGRWEKGRITPKSFLCVCRKIQCWQEYPCTAGGVSIGTTTLENGQHLPELTPSTCPPTHLSPREMRTCSPKAMYQYIHVSPVHDGFMMSVFGRMDEYIVWVHKMEIHTTTRTNDRQLHTTAWMNLAKVRLSEGSRPKNAHSVIPMIRSIKTGQGW